MQRLYTISIVAVRRAIRIDVHMLQRRDNLIDLIDHLIVAIHNIRVRRSEVELSDHVAKLVADGNLNATVIDDNLKSRPFDSIFHENASLQKIRDATTLPRPIELVH